MKWFWISITGQAGALISAILMSVLADWPINLTGAFSAVAAASMAWLQMKRYQDLAQAYALAAHELGLIEVRPRAFAGAMAAQAQRAHWEEKVERSWRTPRMRFHVSIRCGSPEET